MTFPGAETIKVGIVGIDCFRSMGVPRLVFFALPLIPVLAIFSVASATECVPFVPFVPFVLADISKEGEGEEGLVSEGVSKVRDVVLELEYVLVFSGLPPHLF